MSQKTRRIAGWALTILLALFFVLTGLLKLTANAQIMAQTASIGIDAGTTRILGLIEIASIVLFVVPRTGIIGALLLIAYMGGVMATALEHHQPMVLFTVIQAIIWLAVVFRFPEMGQRLSGFPKNRTGVSKSN